MKYSFFTILVITTYLAINGEINIPFNGANFNLNTASPISVIFVVLIITLFTFWTINEGSLKTRIVWKKIYRTYIEQYMKKKNAILVDNLLDEHPGRINESKDVYYHNGKLLLKTVNANIDGVKKYPGYILTIGKAKFCFLYLIGNLRAFLDFNVMPYVALPLYSGIIILILFAQLLQHYSLL